jgi:hypothetical protein
MRLAMCLKPSRLTLARAPVGVEHWPRERQILRQPDASQLASWDRKHIRITLIQPRAKSTSTGVPWWIRGAASSCLRQSAPNKPVPPAETNFLSKSETASMTE